MMMIEGEYLEGFHSESIPQFTDNSNNKKIITLRPEDQETIIKLTNCVLAELEKLRIDTWKPKK